MKAARDITRAAIISLVFALGAAMVAAAPGPAVEGGQQDLDALYAGYMLRLELADPGLSVDTPTGRDDLHNAFVALAALDTGATARARAIARALPAPCSAWGERPAAVALCAFTHASIEFAQARRAAAHELATLGLQQLTQMPRSQRAIVPALASDLALLFVAVSDSDAARAALELGGDATRAGAAHPFSVHLDVARFTLLANDGDTAAAAALLAELNARHGDALARYPATAALLGLGEGALGFMRADHQGGLSASARALTIYRDARGALAPAAAEALNVMALNESALDRNDDAIGHYRDALAIREHALAGNHPLIAELTNNLSVVFHNLGRYDLAEVFITRSLAIDRAFYGNDHEEVASDLSNLAAIYRAMGDADKAIELFHEAVDINTRLLGNRHRRTAIMHHGLGQAYLEARDYPSAFTHFATSINIHLAVDTSSRNIPIARHNLAKAAIELGDYAHARDTLEQVLQRYAQMYDNHHRNIAAGYRDLARAQAGLEHLDAADEAIETAAAEVATAHALEVQWRVYFTLAELEQRHGHPAGAIFFGKLALENLQTLRASQSTLGARLQRAFARQRADSYRQIALWLVDAGRLLEAQTVLEMLKDEEYFDFTRRQPVAGTTTMHFNVLEIEQRERLHDAREQLRASDGDDAMPYRAVLASVRAAFAALDPGTATTTTMAGARGSTPPPGSAFVFYVVGAQSTRVIVVTREQRQFALIPVTRSWLGSQVLAMRSELGRPDGDIGPVARVLHDTLMRPVTQLLDDPTIDTLWLKLDDTLRYLPFAALRDTHGYLIERYALVQMHGATGAAPTPLQASRLAAFALTREHDGFRALPGAAAEANRIVSENAQDPVGVFPGRVWLDQKFNQQTLGAALSGGYDLVHVASHFEFTPGNEKDSFLLLGDGQRLSLYDLRNGDYALNNLRLLTMSGCNTALAGRAADGREMDGFATLAARQGAHNILATLWPVADAGTADFMTHFYALHADGKGFAAALRDTQLAFRNRHPFYWAPFVLWSHPPAEATGAAQTAPGASLRQARFAPTGNRGWAARSGPAP